jgi:hypothetical protein
MTVEDMFVPAPTNSLFVPLICRVCGANVSASPPLAELDGRTPRDVHAETHGGVMLR